MYLVLASSVKNYADTIGKPKGGVLLCHTQQNTRQRRLLERIGETFRQQGHAVMNLPIEQVANDPAREGAIMIFRRPEVRDLLQQRIPEQQI